MRGIQDAGGDGRDIHPERNLSNWLAPKKEIEKISNLLPERLNEAVEKDTICRNTGISPAALDKAERLDNTYQIPTRNQELYGKEHPDTGVPFVKKLVTEYNEKKVEAVVPDFTSLYGVVLPEELRTEPDARQFEFCNMALKKAVQNNAELAVRFTPEQLEQIEDGETPDGYTWHHDAPVGRIQLVDSKTHFKTGHTGGRFIWGNGNKSR